MNWSVDTVRALLDVPVSLSTVLRAAVGLYVTHLDELLAQVRAAQAEGLTPSWTDYSGTCDASDALIRERYLIRQANAGPHACWTEPIAERFVNIDDLPKYSELEEAERKKQAARLKLVDFDQLLREDDALRTYLYE